MGYTRASVAGKITASMYNEMADGSRFYLPANSAARAAIATATAGDYATQLDTGVLYRYTGSAWQDQSTSAYRALCTAARASFTALGNNDLVVVEDPFGMVNAATDTITIPFAGTWMVQFNYQQTGTGACLGAVYVNGVSRVGVGAVGSAGAPANPSASALLVLAAADAVTFRSSAPAATVFQTSSTASVHLIARA